MKLTLNNTTGNIAYRATFPNPDGLLRHGETGNIIIEKPLKKCASYPPKGPLFEVLDQKYVFVIDEERVVRTKHVTVGAELTHLYAITSGLKETDIILLEGLRKVKDGQEIGTEFQKPEEVLVSLTLHAE